MALWLYAGLQGPRYDKEAEIFAVNVKQWKILGFWEIN